MITRRNFLRGLRNGVLAAGLGPLMGLDRFLAPKPKPTTLQPHSSISLGADFYYYVTLVPERPPGMKVLGISESLGPHQECSPVKTNKALWEWVVQRVDSEKKREQA